MGLIALMLASCATGEPESDSTLAVTATTVAADAPVTTVASGGVVADCPQVTEVELTQTAPGVFTVATTVRSLDIEGVGYADAWEVRDLEGGVLGERILTHPHVDEQPFTRTLPGVAIAPAITRVEVAARDSARGYCGLPLTVEVPHS